MNSALWPLPGQLIEAELGMMLVLFLSIAISATVYIGRYLLRISQRRDKFDGVSTWLDVLRIAYPEVKAGFSIAVFSYGLFLRTADVWIVRHIENHGAKPGPFLQAVATPVLIATTFPIVWGAICWMRVTMPLQCPGRPRLDAALRWAWLALGIFAVTFGIYFAW